MEMVCAPVVVLLSVAFVMTCGVVVGNSVLVDTFEVVDVVVGNVVVDLDIVAGV